MKEAMALLIFFVVAGLTIYLAVKRLIGSGLTGVLLAFSLVAGLTVVNYDLLKTVKWEIPGFSLFRNEVNGVKDQALEDLRKEAENQRQTINTADANMQAANEKTDAAIKYAEALLEAIKKAEDKLQKEELVLKELGVKIDQANEQAGAVYRALSDLALMLTRLTWLQFQVRDEADAKRRDVGIRQVMDQLDAIVGLVIEDPETRSEFVNSVMGSLPPRQ
jgi:hypothetical protein